ncbi:MAG: hypothetical protein ACFFEO_13015 [Candidatus Thorarchaeota archaeon]
MAAINQRKNETETKSVGIQEQHIYDWSDITDKELFKTIIHNYAPNLYYFCWLGYLQLEQKSIWLPFEGYKRKSGSVQACLDLSNITIGKKIFTLLEPPRDKAVHQHETNHFDVRISKEGVKVWKKAKEEGVWEDIQNFPKKWYTKEKFISQCMSHIFFERTEYIRKLGEVSDLASEVCREELNQGESQVPDSGEIMVDLDALSSKNIQKGEYIKRAFSIKGKKRRKYSKPNRDMTSYAVGLPHISPRTLLVYAYRVKDWFSQQRLESQLKADTKFERSLATMEKNIHNYNEKRFSSYVGRVVLELQQRGLMGLNYQKVNGDSHATEKLLRITEKGEAFFHYLLKHHYRSISGIEDFNLKMLYRRFCVRFFLRRLAMLSLYISIGFTVSALIIYGFLQLEGILWVPQGAGGT